MALAENLLELSWMKHKTHFEVLESRQLPQRCQGCAAAPAFTENREISRASLWTLGLKDSPLLFFVFRKMFSISKL